MTYILTSGLQVWWLFNKDIEVLWVWAVWKIQIGFSLEPSHNILVFSISQLTMRKELKVVRNSMLHYITQFLDKGKEARYKDSNKELNKKYMKLMAMPDSEWARALYVAIGYKYLSRINYFSSECLMNLIILCSPTNYRDTIYLVNKLIGKTFCTKQCLMTDPNINMTTEPSQTTLYIVEVAWHTQIIEIKSSW